MKRSEAQLKDTFSNQSMTIDAKFKKNLKQRMLKQQKYVQKGRERSSWSKWLILPAAATAAVLVISTVSFNAPNGTNTAGIPPFHAQRVSAAALLEKSEEFKKNFDPSKFSYIDSRNEYRIGPKYLQRKGPMTLEYREQGITRMIIYRDADHKVEAFYNYNETKDGKKQFEMAVYDETDKRILEANNYMTPRSLEDFFAGYKLNGKLMFKITDAAGNVLSDDTITPSGEKGKEVYEFYMRLDPEQARNIPALAGDEYGEEHTNAVTKVVISAWTYEVMEYAVYEGEATEENLVTREITRTEYQGIGMKDALQLLAEAGFDKSKALPDFERGYDLSKMF